MPVEFLDVDQTALELYRDGAGRPIVFLHGSEGIDVCAPLLNELKKLGEVLAPSHPGFGKTPRQLRMKSVDDLAYFYLDAFELLNLSGAIVIGANFGAWIAAEIAIRDSSRISQLILSSPLGVRFSTDECEVEIEDIFTMDEMEEKERTWLAAEKFLPERKTLSDGELLTLVKNRESLCNYAWAPYMHTPVLSRWIKRIKVPTLIVRGEKDGLTSLAYAKKFQAAISGSRLEVFENAAHMPHVEKASAFAKLVDQFALPLAPASR